MNNLVEIKYETTGVYPKVIINGEELTQFSTLSAYIYDDIFRWSNVFFELIDGDLAEGYRVSLTGHPYQAIIMSEAAKKSEFCEGVDFLDYTGAISIANKYAFASRLYNNVNGTSDLLTFRTASPDVFSSYVFGCLKLAVDGNSDYCIAASEEEAVALGGKYCIILSDRNDFVKKGNNVYHFYVNNTTLPVALDYFASYHLQLPLINEVLSNIGKYAFDAETALEFEAYTQEEYRVWVGQFPDQLDEGSVMQLQFKVFPACFSPDNILVISSDNNVVSCDNRMIYARTKGEAVIRIVDSKGKEYYSHNVSVAHHNFATKITVVIPSTKLFVGETMHFRTIVAPINAEDADQITYSVSDERVAVLSNKDELYALAPGRICLTVSTPRTSTRVYITVPTQVCDVKLSTEGELVLPFSSEATIYGVAFPPDAIPLPDLVWSVEKNPNVFKIVSSDNHKCVIRSGEPGQAVLVCSLKDTTIVKKVLVTVPKSGACYIATAVYGSYDCPEVWTLRRYRDEYLDARPLGRLFIKCYYAISPTVVKIFGKSRLFNAFWKRTLDRKIAKLKKKGYESTPYNDKQF